MEKEKARSIFFITAAVCICILTVCVLVLVNRTMNIMNEVSASLTEINTLVGNAEKTLKNIDEVDFETLNQAIKNFAKVVEPIAKMFGN